MVNLSSYEQKLLTGWEEVYKKSQLTLMIMLSLKDGPKHMAEIKAFIANTTDSRLSADDQSLYRALRRYHDAEMVEFTVKPGKGGPDLKIYRLTDIGRNILVAFLDRNIKAVFNKPQFKGLLR